MGDQHLHLLTAGARQKMCDRKKEASAANSTQLSWLNVLAHALI